MEMDGMSLKRSGTGPNRSLCTMGLIENVLTGGRPVRRGCCWTTSAVKLGGFSSLEMVELHSGREASRGNGGGDDIDAIGGTMATVAMAVLLVVVSG